MNTNQTGRKKILDKTGVTHDTMISTTNYDIILTQNSLTEIANIVSSITKQPLSLGEITELTKFIGRLPPSLLYQKTYSQAKQLIATNFIKRKSGPPVPKSDLIGKIVGIDGDHPTIVDYNKKEIAQFTPDENSYKFYAHAGRRGNAVIDEQRMEGKRSSPDNIAGYKDHQLMRTTNQELCKVSRLVSSFLDPESIEKMFNRVQSFNSSFDSLNLVRQLVNFDTRNCLPYSGFKWNIHCSGQTGQNGDIRVQDTIQQVMSMQLFPFSIPLNSSLLSALTYGTLRMLIREFSAQSIIVTEFADGPQSAPTISNYHFELDYQVSGDRVLLTPKHNGLYRFRKPLAQVNTITVQFFTPFQQQVFDSDSGTYSINYGNPTTFINESYSPHMLNTGDLVYIYDSQSGNSNVDNLLNSVNGYYITKISSNSWTIPVDTSALSGSQDNVPVYYGSKRIFFQIEFINLEQ